MLGIGYHLDKRTKQKILQQKAKQYNKLKQGLDQKGVTYDQIPKQIQKIYYQRRHKDDGQITPPYQNSKNINGIGGSLNFGYINAHKTKSQLTDMNKFAQQQFKASKNGTSSVNQMRKQQKQMDQKMKQRIYQDHIDQMTKGVIYSNKPIHSQYRDHYLFTQHMQKQCDTQDFTYHQRKNDLKWYSQEYAKIKTVMRN